ncbi:MAG: DUF2971 domain-containing protein, partial [Leeuwenhoekiella sp.]
MKLPEGEYVNNVDFRIEDGKIETIIKKPIPSNLYKYYSLNRNSCESLENGYLFFSHSFMLNDLMDGNPMLWDMKKYVQKFKYETNDFRSESEIEEEQTKKFQDEYLSLRGILSLSENYKDNLMWPHYTQERGFCLEFNTKDLQDEFKNRELFFFPINYKEKLITIDFKEYIVCSEILKEDKIVINCNANLAIL